MLAKEVECRMLAVSLSDVIDIVNFQLFYPTTASIMCMGEGGSWLWPHSHPLAFVDVRCH